MAKQRKKKEYSKSKKKTERLERRRTFFVVVIVVTLILASVLVALLFLSGPDDGSNGNGPPQFEIIFPRDEGRHNESLEFWKVDFLLENGLGDEFSINVDYYIHEIGSPERVVTLTDEGNISGKDFYSKRDDGSLTIGYEKLNLSFVSALGSDSWLGQYSTGFEYSYQGQVNDGGGEVYHLDVQMTSEKDPILLGDEGKIMLENGGFHGTIKGYMLTRLAVQGTLRFSGQTHSVTGSAWIVHEWGAWALYDMEEFRLHLGTASELYFLRFYEPSGGQIIEEQVYFNRPDGQVVELGSADFTVENLKYSIDPLDVLGKRSWPSKWNFVSTVINTDITFHASTSYQVDRYYWEGSLQVSGEIGGIPGTGRGFTILNHVYRSTLAIESFYGDYSSPFLHMYSNITGEIPVDNATLYYRINGLAWSSAAMSNIGGNRWMASIAVIAGDNIRAYVETYDLAGKRVTIAEQEFNV